ncbi:MAG: hypothetical protein ABS81_05120 [Pseudonocardia sp. SCN 72-86]|nr:MAG: hypothetical protein ABS81_05120 [Pseudonocardia sp. SCN 72-86]
MQPARPSTRDAATRDYGETERGAAERLTFFSDAVVASFLPGTPHWWLRNGWVPPALTALAFLVSLPLFGVSARPRS